MKWPCERTALKKRQGTKTLGAGQLYLDLIMALLVGERKSD